MLVLAPVTARGDVTVTASVRRTTVSVNETFALTISVEGARSASAPDMTTVSEHFSVRSSGSSTNMSMINGRITQSKSFTYVLLPQDIGTFTLGPVRVELGNAEYLSNTIDINIDNNNVDININNNDNNNIDNDNSNVDIDVDIDNNNNNNYPIRVHSADYYFCPGRTAG